jgi:uncharacterized protein YaaN involved in tellurite resistance
MISTHANLIKQHASGTMQRVERNVVSLELIENVLKHVFVQARTMFVGFEH